MYRVAYSTNRVTLTAIGVSWNRVGRPTPLLLNDNRRCQHFQFTKNYFRLVSVSVFVEIAIAETSINIRTICKDLLPRINQNQTVNVYQRLMKYLLAL